MRLRWVAFLCVVFSLAVAGIAPAAIVLDIRLVYEGSYSTAGGTATMTTLSSFAVTDGDTTLNQISLTPGSELVNHQFGMYISVSGLAADQDLAYFQFKPTTTGSVAVGTYTANSYEIDPGPMGASDALPADDWYFFNLLNGTPQYGVDVLRDQNGTGNTYGDYAAYLQIGEASPFKIGTQVLTSGSLGTYGVLFGNNPNRVKIISGNTNGAATDASFESWPTFTGIGDTALFAPRNATTLTWANGTATASTWAAADGDQHLGRDRQPPPSATISTTTIPSASPATRPPTAPSLWSAP